MPVVEFQNHVCFVNVFNDSTSDTCSIYYCHPTGTGSQRDGPLSGIPDLLSNPIILMFHNHAKYSNYSQRDGCFLGN